MRVLTAAALVVSATAIGTVTMSAPAYADGCYSWSRTLKNGHEGSDVRQLQIRIAGYPGYDSNLVIDGKFGSHTESSLKRFQTAYGLTATGVAGTATYNKIYSLQDNDCTPIHFTYPEMNKCNSTWSGGAVSAATAKQNMLLVMWQLEALRHALGDRPLVISSGFRSYACNPNESDSYSRHVYGQAADMTGTPSLCTIVKRARYHGFEEILGPGFAGHSDHAHVANDPVKSWKASNCF